MDVWGDKLKIIDARRVPSTEHEFWKGCRNGYYKRIHARFYCTFSDWNALEPWEQDRFRILAVARSSFTAVVIGRSACRLWGLPLMEMTADVELGYVGKCAHRKADWPTGVKYRTLSASESGITQRKGVRLTTLERSVVDHCRWSTFAEGLIVVEGYLRASQQNSLHKLQRTNQSLGRSRGVGLVRKVLAIASTLSESPAESYAKAILIEAAGLAEQRIEQQAKIDTGANRWRVDFLIDGWLVIEIDGSVKYYGEHGDPNEVIRQERRREVAIQNAGFTVIRATWSSCRDGSFAELVKERLAAGERRTPRRSKP